jgi:glycosyltransferase involved in cell wall biosynthesis
MKLFFVHEVSYQEKVIFEMHEFPELLSAKGHQVYFFEFPERVGQLWSINRFRDRNLSGRVLKESGITLITPFTISAGTFQRMLSLFTTFPALFRSIWRVRPDVIITYAVPTYGLQLLLIAKIFKIPVIYRAIDVSHLIRKSVFNNFVKTIETFLMRKVDFVSCHNVGMLGYVLEKSKKNPDHVLINYPPIQLDDFKRNETDTRDEKLIVFLGTLFLFSGLPNFLIEFKKAKLDFSGYKVAIIGDGAQRKLLEQTIKQLDLVKNVDLLGFKPYSELNKYLSKSLIAINPFEKSMLTDNALPQKVIQYAAAGNLIISTNLLGLRGLFSEPESIFWVENTSEIPTRIREIENMSTQERHFHLKNQDATLTEKLDLEKSIKSFESLLLQVSKREKLH